MIYHPYVMHLLPPMKEEVLVWTDRFRKKDIHCTISTNKLGFQTEIEFEKLCDTTDSDRPLRRPEIQSSRRFNPDTKVVLLTGGSAAWGMGASSQDAMISNVLQRKLDERTGVGRYTVINQAMGGWVSFQQLVGLSRWGRDFPLSWLLCLDGYNDAATTLFFQQGFDKHRFHDVTSGFLHAYLSNLHQPVFYRGQWHNRLLELSALLRKITGQQPIIPPWRNKQKIKTPGGIVFSNGISWSDINKSLRFYLENHEQMALLSGASKNLFGIHPVPQDHLSFFGQAHLATTPYALEEAFEVQSKRLQEIFDKHKNSPASEANWPDALNYFLSTLDLMSSRFSETRNSRQMKPGSPLHCNLNFLFPDSQEELKEYFIDSCHLNDRGQKLVGEFYADYILYSDEGMPPDISIQHHTYLTEQLASAESNLRDTLLFQSMLNSHTENTTPTSCFELLRKLNVITQSLPESERVELVRKLQQDAKKQSSLIP